MLLEHLFTTKRQKHEYVYATATKRSVAPVFLRAPLQYATHVEEIMYHLSQDSVLIITKFCNSGQSFPALQDCCVSCSLCDLPLLPTEKLTCLRLYHPETDTTALHRYSSAFSFSKKSFRLARTSR